LFDCRHHGLQRLQATPNDQPCRQQQEGQAVKQGGDVVGRAGTGQQPAGVVHGVAPHDKAGCRVALGVGRPLGTEPGAVRSGEGEACGQAAFRLVNALIVQPYLQHRWLGPVIDFAQHVVTQLFDLCRDACHLGWIMGDRAQVEHDLARPAPVLRRRMPRVQHLGFIDCQADHYQPDRQHHQQEAAQQTAEQGTLRPHGAIM